MDDVDRMMAAIHLQHELRVADAIFSNAPATSFAAADDELAQLAAVMREIESLPPRVVRIDAPSTMIEDVRRMVPAPQIVPEALRHPMLTTTIELVRLHLDNDLPSRTVRCVWSDGREELLRL